MFGKKNKSNNSFSKYITTKKKGGCRDNFIVLVVFLVLFIVIVVNAATKIDWSKFKGFDFDFTPESPFIEFDVSTITTNPITDADISSFHTKLINAGYTTLAQDFKLENLTNNTTPLSAPLIFTDKEYAVLINYLLDEDSGDAMKIVELKISKQDEFFRFDIIYSYTLDLIEGLAKYFDEVLYSSQTIIASLENSQLTVVSSEATHHSIKEEYQEQFNSQGFDENIPEFLFIFFNGDEESEFKRINEYFLADNYTLDNGKVIINPATSE